MSKSYLFTSERLGFRTWLDQDLEAFVEMNADKDVMEHFPSVLSREESEAFIVRLNAHFHERKHTYFAVDILETGEWIGFIGLAYQVYESDFTPAVDLGWRLKKSAWGLGYATEGAERCLNYAFTDLKFDHIISTCTLSNVKSESVMKKIGMKSLGVFKHPRLLEYPELVKCNIYHIPNLKQ